MSSRGTERVGGKGKFDDDEEKYMKEKSHRDEDHKTFVKVPDIAMQDKCERFEKRKLRSSKN